MRAFKITTNVVRPGKRNTAKAAPSGKPIRLASRTAIKLICSDKLTISAKLLSKLSISAKAAANASLKSDMC